MTDELAKYTPKQVAEFYQRLADKVDANKGALKVSLAAMLMRKWLANRDPKYVFPLDPPPHLISHKNVVEVLRFHRAVYLTEKKASFTGGSSNWAGIVPRLQGKPPHTKWNRTGVLSMEYESLVEFPLHLQVTGSDADRDLLYSLHGFQLKTNVQVKAQPIRQSYGLNVTFGLFEARVHDRYDWDYSEHLTVPNPDYGSKNPQAIAPKKETIVVYHSNAKRVEDAGLAAPYEIKSKPWMVTDLSIMGPAKVDPNKTL